MAHWTHGPWLTPAAAPSPTDPLLQARLDRLAASRPNASAPAATSRTTPPTGRRRKRHAATAQPCCRGGDERDRRRRAQRLLPTRRLGRRLGLAEHDQRRRSSRRRRPHRPRRRNAPTSTGSTVTTAAPITTPSTTGATTTAVLADGTYAGSTDTNKWGPVQVQITVTSGQISNVVTLQTPTKDRKSIGINQRATPTLASEALIGAERRHRHGLRSHLHERQLQDVAAVGHRPGQGRSDASGRHLVTVSARHHVEQVMGTAVSIDVRDDVSDHADRRGRPLAPPRRRHVQHLPARQPDQSARYRRRDPRRHGRRSARHPRPVRPSSAPTPTAPSTPPRCPHPTAATSTRPASSRAGPSSAPHGSSNTTAHTTSASTPAATSSRAAPPAPTHHGGSASATPNSPTRAPPCVCASPRLAIATSAAYERGAHIIDPSTGEPAAGPASVTVVGPDLTYADAYATAVFVMGEPGLEWLNERHPDYAGFLITRQHTALSTANFATHRLS